MEYWLSRCSSTSPSFFDFNPSAFNFSITLFTFPLDSFPLRLLEDSSSFSPRFIRRDVLRSLSEEIVASRWASSSSRGWLYDCSAPSGGKRREGSFESTDTNVVSTKQVRDISIISRFILSLFFLTRAGPSHVCSFAFLPPCAS